MDQPTADAAHDSLLAALTCILEDAHITATQSPPRIPADRAAHAARLRAAGHDIALLSDAIEVIVRRGQTSIPGDNPSDQGKPQ